MCAYIFTYINIHRKPSEARLAHIHACIYINLYEDTGPHLRFYFCVMCKYLHAYAGIYLSHTCICVQCNLPELSSRGIAPGMLAPYFVTSNAS